MALAPSRAPIAPSDIFITGTSEIPAHGRNNGSGGRADVKVADQSQFHRLAVY